ncbi:MAG TPA: disulfide bond formation protein B [Usitatibacter sp.]|jgi:disulfide bond formation protein DsbB|nr:disulfide bond formation protein B [Usitatibacter sp.]
MIRPRRRPVFAAIAVAASLALAQGYYLQHFAALLPCPYCVLQRYVYATVIVAAVIAWADWPRATWHGAATASLATLGAGVAFWQWQHASSMTSCRVDPVGEFVNALPTARWWPDYLFAEGNCADSAATLFGAPIPLWSGGLFLVLAAAAAWASLTRS